MLGTWNDNQIWYALKLRCLQFYEDQLMSSPSYSLEPPEWLKKLAMPDRFRSSESDNSNGAYERGYMKRGAKIGLMQLQAKEG